MLQLLALTGVLVLTACATSSSRSWQDPQLAAAVRCSGSLVEPVIPTIDPDLVVVSPVAGGYYYSDAAEALQRFQIGRLELQLADCERLRKITCGVLTSVDPLYRSWVVDLETELEEQKQVHRWILLGIPVALVAGVVVGALVGGGS